MICNISFSHVQTGSTIIMNSISYAYNREIILRYYCTWYKLKWCLIIRWNITWCHLILNYILLYGVTYFAIVIFCQTWMIMHHLKSYDITTYEIYNHIRPHIHSNYILCRNTYYLLTLSHLGTYQITTKKDKII